MSEDSFRSKSSLTALHTLDDFRALSTVTHFNPVGVVIFFSISSSTNDSALLQRNLQHDVTL